MQFQSFRYPNSLKIWQFRTEKPRRQTHKFSNIFDLRSLSQVAQVINEKLGALNIQQYTYTTNPDVLRADEDAVNALPKSLSYVGRRDEYLPGSRSDDIQIG